MSGHGVWKAPAIGNILKACKQNRPKKGLTNGFIYRYNRASTSLSYMYHVPCTMYCSPYFELLSDSDSLDDQHDD